jgi:signal transduction histidine kinase
MLPSFDDRLADLLLSRRASAAILQSLMIVTLLAVFGITFWQTPERGWLASAIVLMSATRYTLAVHGARLGVSRTTRRRTLGFYKMGLVVQGLLWGLVYATAVRDFGMSDVRSVATLLVVGGMSVSITSSLAPYPHTYVLFILCVLIPTAGSTWLYSPEHGTVVLTGSTFSLWFFCTQVFAQHKFLFRTLEAEKLQAQSRAILENILNAVPGKIVSVSSQGEVSLVNASMRAEQAALLAPGSELRNRIGDFMSSGKISATTEAFLTGSWQLLSLCRHEEGAIAVLVPIDELKEAQKQVLQHARLASLGEMAGGIAHEVNNPLTVIFGHLSLIQQRAEENDLPREELLNAIRMIQKHAERAARVIRSLLVFSRDEEKQPLQLKNLQEIVQTALDVFARKIESKGIRFKVQELDEDGCVNCHPSQLSQVLMNLLSNSLDAVSGLTGAEIELRITRAGAYFELEVSDNGPGIPAHLQDKVLQPFFTTKEIGKGTGLGLSTSLGIARTHGGDLILRSTKNPTAFVLRVPVAQAEVGVRAA